MPARTPSRPIGYKILHRRIFWRGLLASTLLAGCLLGSGTLSAQDELPQINPGEHKFPTKKDTGPRAVGLLQLGANGKASLVPIAIMVDGKFWDASAYKADPVPMALESGNVYEVEQTGSSQGLFTVNAALHSNAVNSPTPWIATGSWVPAGTEKKSTSPKAESTPVGIDTIDAPPRLTRNPAPANNSPAPAGAAPASTPDSKSGSGDEPPRLTKPASPPPSSTPTNSQGDSKGNSGSAPSTPTGTNPSTPSQSGSKSSSGTQAKKTDQPPIPTSDSDTPEANRPRLRRGKPAESFADDDIPGYSKPGTSSSAAKVNSPTPAANNPPAQLIPAISDAKGPEPRSFAFEWLKDEEAQRRQQMLDFSKQQFQIYMKAQARATTTATAQSHHPAAHAAAKKLPDPVFENVKFSAYDLWVTNQPILILSADAHLPSGWAPEGTPSDVQYSVTVVAYPDIYNNLHKLYAGVTDKYHLDITPRLELVDAVDADGDGRGELLFREISDAGTGWIIYRATADSLWKMYDSLNPE
jgi:hypothetical protein